jgi:cell wall assembly regulator SMI1
MQMIWKRIEDWLNIHAPELTSLLQAGASEKDIQQTEVLLHVTFPEDIRASYRIHNGSGGLFPQSHFIVKSHALLSLQEMVDYWRMVAPPAGEQYPDEPTDLPPEFLEEPEENWRSLLSPEQDTYVSIEEGYDRQLIPFLRCFDEGLLCFDTDLTHNTYGMIIDYFAQSGFLFSALSWHDLLSSFADDLEAGKYRVERWDNHTSVSSNDPIQRPI